jgi:ABC-2 type transport system permease protein
MFGKLYLGEMKKLLRPKAVIILAIIFVVFFVIFAVFYNINWEAAMIEYAESEEDVSEYIDTIFAQSSIFETVTPEDIDSYIDIYESEYNTSVENEDGLDYYYKGTVTLLNYIKANDLYGQDLNIAGYTSLEQTSAEDFAMTYFSFVLSILIIYAIVAMASIYVDEYKNGTIKLMMMRPITRNQLTLAKILSMFTVLLGYLGIATLIGYLYGLAAFGSASTEKFLVLFNATSVSEMNYGGYVFLEFLFGAISMLSYGLLSYTLGTVFRKKTPAILIGLVIMMGLVSSILSFISVDRFLFSNNINLIYYWELSYIMPAKANFFIAMPVLVLYLAVMYFVAFYLTNKRDII